MGRCRALLLLAPIAIGPTRALACGVCVDAAILQSSWWTTGVHFVVVALLLELIVFGLVTRIRKDAYPGRARWLLGGVVLGLGMTMIGGGTGFGLSLGLALCLTIRFGLSARDTGRDRPRLASARIVAVAIVVGLGLFSSRPAARSTPWLVGMVDGLLHRSSVPAHLVPTSWAERELVGREDAPALLIARLGLLEPQPHEHHRNRGRILSLLRAHTMAGGDPRRRHEECHRLGVDPGWSELVRSLNAGRVCGFETASVAAVSPPGS